MLSSINDWLRQSVTVKFIVIGILSLILLIPAAMIQGLIREREAKRNEVVGEVSSKWGTQQTLSGPFLTVPYKVPFTKGDGSPAYQVRYAYFMPEHLDIQAKLEPEIRYRSIYEVVAYRSDIRVSGAFRRPAFDAWKIDPGLVMWDEAFLSLGIPDMHGISEEVAIAFRGKTYGVNPGIPTRDLADAGVSATVDLGVDSSETSFPFAFGLKLNGSESLSFVPVGKTTKVTVTSPWKTPSFDGAFLPGDRQVTDTGFTATWTVLHLNRNFPQAWTDHEYSVGDWSFGVTLLFPVDQYQKAHRATRYAMMFIALTFLVFFFTEVLNKKRVHPIQYLLIGFALCLFYSLLISLAEHLGFAWAFAIGAVAIVALVTAYASAVMRSRKLTLLVGGVLTALYVFLYTILQLEAYALLMGSIALFLVMAVVMYLSRNVDWYKPINRAGDQP